MHPIIGEICRTRDSNLRPDVLRRWQRELQHDVQAKLDRLEALEAKTGTTTTKEP